MQGPTRQQQINAAIQSARNYNQLRAVIEFYRDDLIGTNGAKIDGKELLSDIQYIIDDTIRKGVVDEFSLNAVTRNYGLRDKLRECCLSVKAEQAQQNFPQLIASAKNIDELIKVINDFPHPILGSDGTPIQKSIAIQKIREMSSEPSAVDAIATMPSVPMIFFAGSHITSSYGLRDKFVSLVKEQYQAQKILSQENEQEQTKGVKFSENVEKREFQFDPGEEVREGIARGIRRKSASEKPRSGKLLGEEVPRAVIAPEIATRHQQFTDMIGLTKAYMANHLDSVNRFGIKRYDDEAINQLQMKVYDIENALHNGELPPESIVNEFLSTLEKCPVDEDFPSEQKLISDVINIIKMAGAEQPQPKQALAKQKEIEFGQKIQSAKTIDALTTAIQEYPADIKNSQGIIMDKQKMIAAMSTILSKPEDVAAIVARGGMVAEQVKAANITGAHGIYDKFLSLVKAQHQQNLLAKAEQANAQKPQQNLPEKNQQEAPNFAAKASPKIQPEVVVNQISVDKAHEIIRDLMSEMNSNQMTWGIRPGDNRMAYLGPLFTNLAGIIRNDNLTPDQKLLNAHAMIDAVAANKAPDAFNARRIADYALEELKGRPEFAQLLDARMQRPLPKTPDSPPDLPPLPKEVQQPEVVPPQKPPRMQKPVSQQPVEPKAQAKQVPLQTQPETKGLLSIKKKDWAAAKKFFAENPNAVKFSKKGNKVSNSFIQVNGEIFAIKSGKCLGEGAFGKVRILQNEQKVNFAVKIEGRGKRGEDDAELKAMKLIGQLKGEAAIQYGKEFKGEYAAEKLYTVMQLHKGKELWEQLYIETSPDRYKEKSMSAEQKLLFAVKSAEAIKFLHDNGIIHADIKPQNFMANAKGNLITVGAIDFGFAMVLAQGQDKIITGGKGTPDYMAPEVYRAEGAEFSFASDIYALGAMYKNNFKIEIPHITDRNPATRPNMDQLLDQLYQRLEAAPNLSNATRDLIEKRKIDRLPDLLAMTKENIEDLYKFHSKSHSSSSMGRWMSNIHKDSGKVVFGKEKTRQDQIQLLSDCIAHLNGDPFIGKIEKAEKIHAILSKIESEIGKEHNTRKSGMAEMVSSQRQKLEDQYPNLKTKSPESILSTEKDILSRVRPTEVESHAAKHNKNR